MFQCMTDDVVLFHIMYRCSPAISCVKICANVHIFTFTLSKTAAEGQHDDLSEPFLQWFKEKGHKIVTIYQFINIFAANRTQTLAFFFTAFLSVLLLF